MKFKTKRKKSTIQPGPISPARCAGCYKWPKKIAAMSVYVPVGGGYPIPYGLCGKCAERVRRGDVEFARQIESYITDQPVAPAN